ncbi:MAG: OmpA family protein [Mariprofundales bacterium]|nr:OmpA family protein [Mariprofundales bacterium]
MSESNRQQQQRVLRSMTHRSQNTGGGADASSASADTESWMVAYLDLMSLLLAFFIIMGALSHAKNGVNMQGKEKNIESQSTPGKPVSMDATVKRQGQKSGMNQSMQKIIGSNSLGGMVDVHVDPGQVRLQMKAGLLFPGGGATLTAKGKAALNKLASIFSESIGRINVEGHSDNLPINTAQYHSNWGLSAARAVSVVEELIALGVPAARLHASAYGDTRPRASNDSPEGRAKNRRVEFVLEIGQEFIHQRKRTLRQSGTAVLH